MREIFHFTSRRGLIAYVHDMCMVAISFWLSFYLRVGELWSIYTPIDLIPASVLLCVIATAVFWLSGLYRGVWRYASIADLWAITKAVTLVFLLFSFSMFLWMRLETFPRSILVINWFVLMMLLGGPRFLYRLAKDRSFEIGNQHPNPKQIPVLLLGAGDESELFIRALRQTGSPIYRIVGIISENKRRIGSEIHGIEVLGSKLHLVKIIKSMHPKDRPQRLIMTKDNFDRQTVRYFVDKAEELGMTLARAPRVTDFKFGISDAMEVRDVVIEDLLGRPQTPLDRESMKNLVEGKRVLITGAGGSIGSELVRQLSAFCPKFLTLVDQSEYGLYTIDLELTTISPDTDRQIVIADVRNKNRINQVIKKSRPELVFHAAALKHVPLVEANIFEGMMTNVIGTANVADACINIKVKTMVLVSTDKAINPTSFMGASKRLAEMYCQALDLAHKAPEMTRFTTVRFGNVLGSTGSVVPLFKQQLSAGGPLTVTHPEMTRYFMTIKESVELILQASALGHKDREGTVFVLDMGEPVKIIDLATQMIRLAGLQPGQDIEVKITNPRPGEKLFEELLHSNESLKFTESEGIFLSTPRTVDMKIVKNAVGNLKKACEVANHSEVLGIVRSLVPEFGSQKNE